MQTTYANVENRPQPRRAGRFWVRCGWALLVITVIAAAIVALGISVSEPVRRRMELELNRQMQGYTVTLPGLDLHPLAFSLTLRDLTVRQQAHPEPPVLVIDALTAGVHWRALLSLRVVADFLFESPRIHIDRRQLVTESNDPVPVEDKGWQEALESIYPLKINQLRVNDGALTYVDDDPAHPLELTQLNLIATNIRNIRAPRDAYPSPVHASAALFDSGRLQLDGDANFLATPHPTVRTTIELNGVPLQRLKPVAEDVNVHVTGGVLSARGEVEYATEKQRAHLVQAAIDNIAVDYTHSPKTAAAEAQRVDQVREAAVDLAGEPAVTVAIDTFELRNATLGYVDQTTKPAYRISLDGASIAVSNLSNQPDAGRGWVTVKGRFMGSGISNMWSSFMPRTHDPEIDLAVQIEDTQMKSMNELFRAYGDFDVAAGQFSFFTELHIAHGYITGYVKPLFSDLDVYDRRQDAGDSLPHQFYEGLVGGVSMLLENRHDRVATEATLSGSARSPNLSTWEVVVNLVRNAFFDSIMPGLDHAIRDAKAHKSPDGP